MIVSKAKQLIHDKRKSMNKDIIQDYRRSGVSTHSHRVIRIIFIECKKSYLEVISVPLCLLMIFKT